MKKMIVLFLLVFGSTSSSFAASAPASSEFSKFGLGVASLGGNSVITGWIPLGGSAGIQPYFSIPTTRGGFNFSAGGAFKTTIVGNYNSGFHLGGDVLLGNTSTASVDPLTGLPTSSSTFTASFGGLLGVHYRPVSSILVQFDAGPQLNIAGGSADFGIGAFSTLLGASVIYSF